MDPARPLPETIEGLAARWRTSGDAQAFGALFDATAGTLFRVALTLVPDPATAEDVLQQTYAVAIRKLARLAPGRPVMPWLVNVLSKEAAKARRVARRRPDAERVARPVRSSLAAVVEGSESETAVREAIESLDEPYRSVALLRWRYGLEPSEIAHVRGEPPGTTRSLLSRALERLRGSSRVLACAVAIPASHLADAGAGLAAVRRAVMRDAASVGPTAVGVGATVLLGGLAMKKILAVVAVLLALGSGAWWAVAASRAEPDRTMPPPSPETVAVRPTLAPEAPIATAAEPNSAVRGGRSRTVRGVVVDARGKPIAGASVMLYPRDRAEWLELDSAHPDPTLEFATTAADGTFAETLPAATGMAMLVVAPHRTPAFLDPIVEGDAGRIVLEDAAALHGRVLDVAGRPISGASVALYVGVGADHTERHATSGGGGEYRIDDVPVAPRWGTTRAVATTTMLVIDAPDYARLILQPAHELGREPRHGEDVELNVVLSRGARLDGRVVDLEGKPVGGARVLFWTLEGLTWTKVGQHPSNPYVLGEARTDADGRFAFAHVPTRGFHDAPNAMDSMLTGKKIGSWVAAAKPGLTTAVHEVTLAEDGATLAVDVVLRAALSIEGRVVDGHGRPISGAQVWANSMREGVFTGLPAPFRTAFPTENGSTAADGTYRLDGVGVPRPGDPALGVGARAAAGRYESNYQGAKTAWMPVPPPWVGVLRAPDLVLPDDVVPWTRVRVVDAQGAPVANAQVGLGDSVWLAERTDENGEVRMAWQTSLPAEVRLPPQSVYARANGRGAGSGKAEFARTAGAEPPTTTIRLAAPHQLAGRVRARGGTLPEGTQVTVGNGSLPLGFVFAESGAGVPETGVPKREDAWTRYARVDVAGDGSFVVDDLPPGPWHVLASAPKPSVQADVTRRHEQVVAFAESVTGEGSVDLVLPVDGAPASRSIDVRVLDGSSDEPVLRPWGEFAIFPPSKDGGVPSDAYRRIRARPMLPGSLRFEGVPLGTWTLSVGGDGYVATYLPAFEVGVSLGEVPIVRLSRGTKVYGVVTGPDGAPFENGQLFLAPFDSHGGLHATGTRTQGRYEVPGVAPGRYLVSAFAPVTAPVRRLVPAEARFVDVNAGDKEVRFDMRLVSAGHATATLFDSTSEGRRIAPESLETLRASTVEIADEGREVIARRKGLLLDELHVHVDLSLAPGTYWARALVSGQPEEWRRVEVVAGKDAGATFTLPRNRDGAAR